MRHLLLLTLLSLATLAGAQTTRLPNTTQTPAPTIGAVCTWPTNALVDDIDGNRYRCLAGLVVRVFAPAGGSATGLEGAVQLNIGGAIGADSALLWDTSLKALQLRHLFFDQSGDGVPDIIPITDLDGNGTYTFMADLVNTMAPYVGDLQVVNTINGSINATSTAPNKPARRLRVGTAVEGTGIQAGTTVASITGDTTFTLSLAATATGAPTLNFVPAARWDVDQDGTNESMGILFLLPAGARVLAGFHDSLWIYRGGWTLAGAGEDSSFIDVVGDCSVQGNAAVDDFDSNGVADYLDNNDGAQNFGSMFAYMDTRASRIKMTGFQVDGGSNQYLNTRLLPGDANFCDANGGSGPNACNRGGGKWCPLDEHFIFNSGTTDNATNLQWDHIRIRRADSNAWEMDGQGSGTGKRNWVWDRVDVFGSGEESIQMRGEGTISNSHFEQCGAKVSDCITLSPGFSSGVDASRQQIVANNVFRDCGGPCIKAFMVTADANSKLLNLTVTGNDYRTNNTYANMGFLAARWSPSSASQLHSMITITGNTLECGVMINGADCIQLSSNDTTANTWPTPPSSMTYDKVTIKGNTIHVDGDSSSDSAQSGINITRGKNMTIALNTIVLDADTNAACAGGAEDRAIFLNKSIDSTIGPNDITVNGECSFGISVVEGSNLTFLGGKIKGPGATANANDAPTGIRFSPAKDSSVVGVNLSSWLYGVRAFSTSTGNSIAANRCSSMGFSCVELNSSNEQRNEIKDNIAQTCGASCFQENAGTCAGGANAGLNCTSDGNCPASTCSPNVTNTWQGNTGRSGAGLYSARMLAGHGFSFQPDTNNDGTNDSSSCFLLHKLTDLCGEGETQDFGFSRLRFRGAGTAFFDIPSLTATQATTVTVLGTNTAAANLPFVRFGTATSDPVNTGADLTVTTTLGVTNLEAGAACTCSPDADLANGASFSHCYRSAVDTLKFVYKTSAAVDIASHSVAWCCTEQ